jgi:thiamine-phosphate pyrophosphorylase
LFSDDEVPAAVVTSLKFTPPKIYPITDTLLSGLSHAEQAERLIAGGARIVQLREKRAGAGDFYRDAARAVHLAADHGLTVIINDRVDIALALGTGVHLGQSDLPPEKAREILGPAAIIGFSTHNARQAADAARLPIDYIAVGPAFQTLTKEDPDPVIGLEGIKAIKAIVGDMPLVAIGGINEKNIMSVIDAGADSAAMIGALVAAPEEITMQMRRFITLLRK